MIRFLFGRLTGGPKRGQALFDHAVIEARREHWYRDGEVADTIDGRFAVLATLCAVLIVVLEAQSEAGEAASAALTERFIESMDSEHRELGLNDPGLGRRVRKLVGSLERRVDEWRAAIEDELEWDEAVVSGLYRGDPPRDEALRHSARALRDLRDRLSRTPEAQFLAGDF